MSSLRFQALQSVATGEEKKISGYGDKKITSIFGSNVFSGRIMREHLSDEAYKSLVASTIGGKKIDRSMGNNIANGLKAWAEEKGDTDLAQVEAPSPRNVGISAGGINLNSIGPGATTVGSATRVNQLALTIDSTNMTAYSAAQSTYANTQDGNSLSQLTAYTIDNSGILQATYDNGRTLMKGQLAIANFNNTAGLIPVGNNSFEMSGITGLQSGDAIYGTANSGNLFGPINTKATNPSARNSLPPMPNMIGV